jgi:hypothetical protein
VPTSAKKTPKKTIKINDPKRAKVRQSAKRRKNLILDQDKIDRAKVVLGVATETEAIDRALDVVNDFAAFQEEIESGLPDLLGKGGFTDRFPSSLPHEAR